MLPKACTWDTDCISCMLVSASGSWFPGVVCRVVLLLVSLLAFVLEPYKAFKVSFLPQDPSTSYSHCRHLHVLFVWHHSSSLTWTVAFLSTSCLLWFSNSFSLFSLQLIILLFCFSFHSSQPIFYFSPDPRLCLFFHSLWTGWFLSRGHWTGIECTLVCL